MITAGIQKDNNKEKMTILIEHKGRTERIEFTNHNVTEDSAWIQTSREFSVDTE